jgi:hypothetical protein
MLQIRDSCQHEIRTYLYRQQDCREAAVPCTPWMRTHSISAVDHGARVCAITQEIAEKSKTFRPAISRVPETGSQRFQVAVDVGQQGC